MWAYSKKKTIILVLICLVQFSIFADYDLNEQSLKEISESFGAPAGKRVKKWKNLMDTQRGIVESDQLYNVNKFFNQFEFEEDIKNWKRNDYWATPMEFLIRASGDCEDFAIAKYYTLVKLGIPDSKLRLMYVTATRPRQAHMVLAYYETPSSIPYVLDNLNKKVLLASKRRDLLPIYSFNGEGLWLAKSNGRGRLLQSKGNNKLWLEVRDRIENGF